MAVRYELYELALSLDLEIFEGYRRAFDDLRHAGMVAV
jgi:hypothetical protein